MSIFDLPQLRVLLTLSIFALYGARASVPCVANAPKYVWNVCEFYVPVVCVEYMEY